MCHISVNLRRNRCVLILSGGLFLLGCYGGPSRVNQPGMNAAQAGAAAMKQYDSDGDGRVAGQELDAAPGIKSALQRLDKDGDGGVTADEVAKRIEEWQQMGVGLSSFRFKVLLNNVPLEGATVVFEPELFLGDEIQTSEGITGEGGLGIASVPKDKRPRPDTPPGTAFGLYKVRITHSKNGKEQIPARFNSDTILGQEAAFDVPEIQDNRVVYTVTTQ